MIKETIMTEPTLDLIIRTESRVLTCNITEFQQQVEHYLAGLTATFETDDDFAPAKEEVKELEILEKRTQAAIDAVLNGNKDISDLIDAAREIAERFRQERLSRDKLVKSRENDVKQGIIHQAFERIINAKCAYENDVSLALERRISKNDIKTRLEDAAKRRSTLASLTKAINAAENELIAEITVEAARLAERRKRIPFAYDYLFKDWLELIIGEDDLQPIIDERIAAERQREAEIKAKEEQKSQAKAEAEKVQVGAKTIAEEMEQQAVTSTTQNVANEDTTEPKADFVITIRLNQITQTNAVNIARELKARFGDMITLNKVKLLAIISLVYLGDGVLKRFQ